VYRSGDYLNRSEHAHIEESKNSGTACHVHSAFFALEGCRIFLPIRLQVSADEGASRSLLASKRDKKNNQAAQAIEQSKLFGGGINQGQAGGAHSHCIGTNFKTFYVPDEGMGCLDEVKYICGFLAYFSLLMRGAP
jgi:hypothetical protein